MKGEIVIKYLKLLQKLYVNYFLVLDKSPAGVESELSKWSFEIFTANDTEIEKYIRDTTIAQKQDVWMRIMSFQISKKNLKHLKSVVNSQNLYY